MVNTRTEKIEFINIFFAYQSTNCSTTYFSPVMILFCYRCVVVESKEEKFDFLLKFGFDLLIFETESFPDLLICISVYNNTI